MAEYRLILQGLYGQGGIHKLTSNSNKVGNIKTQLINARNIKNKGTKITKNQIDIKIGPKIFNNSDTLPTNNGMIMVVKKMPIIAEQKSNEPINNFNANIPKNVPKKNSCIQVIIRENGQNKEKYVSIYLILKQLEQILGGLPEKVSEGTYCRPFIFKAPTGEMKKYTVAQFDRMIQIIEALYDEHIADDFKIKNRRCIIEAVNEMELQHLPNDDPIKTALEYQRKLQRIPNNAENKYPQKVKYAAYTYLCRTQPANIAYFNMYLKPKPAVTKLINPLKSENEILTKEEVLAILQLLIYNQDYQFFHPNKNGTKNKSDFQGMSKETLNRFIEQLHSIIANKDMFMTELGKYFKKHQLQKFKMNELDEIIELINSFNRDRLFKESINHNKPIEEAYKRIHQLMEINISHLNLSPVHTPSPVNRGPPPPYQPPAYDPNLRPSAYNPNWRPDNHNKFTLEIFIKLVNEQLRREPIKVFGVGNGLNTLQKITNFYPDFKIEKLYTEIMEANIPYSGIKEYVKERISTIILSGGQKEYIKLQSGGKRLVRNGKRITFPVVALLFTLP